MNAAQRAMQRVSGSTLGAAFFRLTKIGAQDRLLSRLTGGRATVTGIFVGFPTVFVTTTGARSGTPHRVALIGLTDPAKPGCIGLIASNFGQSFDPDWCRNLRRHPEATVLADGAERRYVATEVTGPDHERWFRLGTELYSGYPGYAERAGRHIPVFELEPIESPAGS